MGKLILNTVGTLGKAVVALLALASCQGAYDPLQDYEQLHPSTQLSPPAAAENPNFTPQEIAQGRYLLGLLGCGSCHTNGALIGEPDMKQLLAGSDIGIAWTNPLADIKPGVVYPANLTPDIETGIGSWSVVDIVAMIKTGTDKHSGQTLSVMPWPSYAQLNDTDARAIAAYLKSLPAVKHQVPSNVRPGQSAPSRYVHFGVYQSKR